jgi:hypothetical protein
MKAFKEFCKDFPTQGGQVVVALFLILLTGMIVVVRLAIGKPFPVGYEDWLLFLGAAAGIANIGMIGKRATDRELHRIKAGGGPTVTVDTADNVTVEPQPQPPAPPAVPPPSSTAAPIPSWTPVPTTSAASASPVTRDD